MSSPVDDYFQRVESRVRPFVRLDVKVVSELLEKGAPITENAMKYALQQKYTPELVRLFLQKGGIITSDMLYDVIDKNNMSILFVILDERNNLPLTFDMVKKLATVSYEGLEKAVKSIAKGHPSQEVVKQYMEFLVKLPTLDAFSAFVSELNINIDDLLEDVQEITPKLISKKEYPRSKRAVTKMRRILGRIPSKILVDKSGWNLEHNTLCFCWDINIGEHTDLYIPVTRYGESAGIGFYGSFNYGDPSFTWYYVEPDSDFVLRSKRAFVARNKIQAFLLCFERPEINTVDIYNDVYLKVRMELSSQFKSYTTFDIRYQCNDEFIKHFLSPDEIKLVKDDKNNITSFFRDWTNEHILFQQGKMDFLDTILSDIMNILGYDVLVLTHQPGNYGRLVSECLDVRKRSISFENIYEIA